MTRVVEVMHHGTPQVAMDTALYRVFARNWGGVGRVTRLINTLLTCIKQIAAANYVTANLPRVGPLIGRLFTAD